MATPTEKPGIGSACPQKPQAGPCSTLWALSHQQDQAARLVADRHYNRRKPGSRKFCPPGQQLVLKAPGQLPDALWVTLNQRPEFTDHQWPDAWVNSLFRNEGTSLSSALIIDALAVTRYYWPTLPQQGCITFVDSKKVKPKQPPGFCYLKAGFTHVGFTKVNGLHVFQLLPALFPAPRRAAGDFQLRFF